MELKYTRQQVARGSRADAERFNVLYLLKSASKLRATYQIRLLLFRAVKSGEKLELHVPEHCVIWDDLDTLIRQYHSVIKVVRR